MGDASEETVEAAETAEAAEMAEATKMAEATETDLDCYSAESVALASNLEA